MNMEHITTVLGEVELEQVGWCQPHEHVYIVETPALIDHAELRINNLQASIHELAMYKNAGGRTLVDANPLATGRDARALAEASRMSGVNIIATTGYHIPIFYSQEHWIWTVDESRLTNLFIEELNEGMYLGGCYGWPECRTSYKAGLVKAMLTGTGVEGKTKELLSAAGRAAKETGTSLMLHTEYGKGAIEAVELLGKIGLPADRILMCHVDRQAEDYSIHEAIASTGVFMEYDTITLFEFHDNLSEINLLRHMLEKGFKNQILLSTDPTVDRLKSYGADVGMDYILTSFAPQLKAGGFEDALIKQFMVTNPAQALKKLT